MKDYYASLNPQEPDIINLKFSHTSRFADIGEDAIKIFEFNLIPSTEELNFDSSMVKDFDYERGFQIIFDEEKNEMFGFKFYDKSGMLSILLGQDIESTFFKYIGGLNNSRN